MSRESNKLRVINELKSEIEISEVNSIIEKLVHEIYLNGCEVLIGKVRPNSHRITGNICSIILNVNEPKDKLIILWNLFHEYGHHQDKQLLNKDIPEDEKRREKTAWIYADQEFLKYPELQKYELSYLEFRARSLKSYDIDDYDGII